MHIKTNIELSSIQIITLAICPLLTVIFNVNDALFMVAGTAVCLILSQLFCLIFNKYLSNNIKAMLTAIISAFVVVVAMIISKEFSDGALSEKIIYVVFSTTALSTEFIYLRKKASNKNYVFHFIKIILLFFVEVFLFAMIKEILSKGTIFGSQIGSFTGVAFFETVVSDLFILATICFLLDMVVRFVEKKIETKNMVYQKYIKIIRSEKAFQYDKLRRERLLTNEIEINKINAVDAEKIAQKESENEQIGSVQEVIAEETETADLPEESSIGSENSGEQSSQKNSKDKKEDKK